MPIAAIEFHDPIAACPRPSPYRIARPTLASPKDILRPWPTTDSFPYLLASAHVSIRIGIRHPSLRFRRRSLRQGAPQSDTAPTDPRGPLEGRQQRTGCWTIHLQMRFETSNLPIAIHQKYGPYIGTDNNRSFYPYCREIRLDFDKRHGYRGTMRRFNFTKHVPRPTIDNIQR